MSAEQAESPFHLTLGDRLRKARRAKGLSAKQMAEYLDVHRNTIGGYENDRLTPNRRTLIAWAQRTGRSVEELTADPSCPWCHGSGMDPQTGMTCSCGNTEEEGDDSKQMQLRLDPNRIDS